IWRYSEFVNAHYSYYNIQTQISIGKVFLFLLTFQIPPYATMIISTVSVIWVFVTFSMYDKIMLSGTEYQEINADNQDPLARRVYNVVEEMKVADDMRYMPKVF
ncbi:zinc metalloprotease HtpX, partial [Francisella tularensis subsp. holarctica]|nr:zinc metalloprotease HtpX [Francisella tularensis subsp. holarctica]